MAALTNGSTVIDSAFTTDSKSVLVSTADGYVTRYDAASGQATGSWKVGNSLGGMDITADGKYLVVAEEQTAPGRLTNYATIAVHTLNLATGEVKTYTTDSVYRGGPFTDVASSTDGHVFLSETGSYGAAATAFDPETGTFTASASAPRSGYATLTSSSDHTHLIYGVNSMGGVDSGVAADPSYPSETIYANGAWTAVAGSANNDYPANTGQQAVSNSGTYVAEITTYNNGGGSAPIYIYQTILGADGTTTTSRVNLLANNPDYAKRPTSDFGGIAFSADEQSVYLQDAANDVILRFSTRDWTLQNSITIGTDVATGTNTSAASRFGEGLEVSADGHYLTVLAGNTVQTIDLTVDPNAHVGTAGNDVLTGGAADETFTGLGGDDTINGAAGIDAAIFASTLAGSSVSYAGGTVVVTGPDGHDTLTGIETLRFSDGQIDVAGGQGIAGQYAAYMGRDATGAELSFWEAQVAARNADLTTVRSAILSSSEGQAHTTATVTALYGQYAGRDPSGDEINTWKGLVANGDDFATVRRVILDSNIGQAHTTATVTSLYEQFAGRDPTADEINTWKGLIRSGDDFAQVRRVILDADIGQAHTHDTVTALYEHFAGRAPTGEELAFWAHDIRDNGSDFGNVRGAIISAPIGQAYAAGVINGLYEDYAGRAATTDEVNFWRGTILNNGADFSTVRATVLADPIGQNHTTAEVTHQYQTFFGRDATADEQSVWHDLIGQGATFDVFTDTLIRNDAAANAGTRHLPGTANSDTFDLTGSYGHAVIDGFDPVHDTINFSKNTAGAGTTVDTLHATQVTAFDGSTDVLIYLDDQHATLITHVTLADLNSTNIHLV